MSPGYPASYLHRLPEGPSPHFSPGFVARRFKGARWLGFATEGRAGVADTTLSSTSERKPDRACHGAVAADAW
jgi:hypothetical protein